MLMALESGADDIHVLDEEYEVIASPDYFNQLQTVFEQNKIDVLTAQVAMMPDTTVALNDDDAAKMMKLIDALEEHDDVQEVHTNADIPDEVGD